MNCLEKEWYPLKVGWKSAIIKPISILHFPIGRCSCIYIFVTLRHNCAHFVLQWSADRSCGRGVAAAEEGCRVFACGPRQFVRQQRGLGTSYYSHPRLCVCWSHAAWLWSYLLQWKLLTLQLPSCKLGTSQQLPTLPLLHLCPV